MRVVIVLALTLMGAKVSTAADLVCTTGEAEIIFVLDGSPSKSTISYAFQQEFAANVSSAFKVGPADTRFGAVLFAHSKQTTLFAINRYYTNQQISKALLTAPVFYDYPQKSDTGYGLNYAKNLLSKARPTANKVVIVITESLSQSPPFTKSQASNLKRDNVTIFVVGVKYYLPIEWLTIASQNDYVFRVDSYTEIGTKKDYVIEEICQVTGGNLQPQCPNGQVVGSQCLTLSSQKRTNADATQSCTANNGGKIFEIKSEELYIQLGDIAKEKGLKLWAGAKEVAEGDWKWLSDNSSANIQKNWFKCGEPNNWRGNEECLQMRPDGKLNDAHCDKRFHFVCVN